MTKLRLEKVGLNKYLQRINLSPTNICEQCNSGEIEDVSHYLLACQKFHTQRTKLFTFMRNNNFNHITINDLLGAANTDTETLKRITYELGIFIQNTKRMDTL